MAAALPTILGCAETMLEAPLTSELTVLIKLGFDPARKGPDVSASGSADGKLGMCMARAFYGVELTVTAPVSAIYPFKLLPPR
jgi:hypothetical protein